jgi:hypothetical protein
LPSFFKTAALATALAGPRIGSWLIQLVRFRRHDEIVAIAGL